MRGVGNRAPSDMGARILLLCLCAAVAAGGCAHHPPGVRGVAGASPAPEIPWTPPRGELDRLESYAPAAPPSADLLSRAEGWTLPDLIDLALRRNSETREAWEAARSAAAAYGSEKGARYPALGIGGDLVRERTDRADGSELDLRTYGFFAELDYLLFDFGGRGAAIDETRQAMFAADWTHNAVIQDAVLGVEEAYFGYWAAKALLDAEESTLEEARANREAAGERNRAGLATIADVLQAETALSQTQLAVDGLRGSILTTRGALATAVGIPANTEFDVEPPADSLPLDRVTASVEELLDRARTERPDLRAVRARAVEARAHLRKVRAEGYPALSLSAGAARTYYDDPDVFDDSYRAALSLRFPLFTGFSHRYDVFEARADAEAALARLESAQRAVVLDVWTSYYDFKTADQRIRTSEALMKSATESHEVALGRYTSGVGSVLDLLAAQSALDNARAEKVRARSDWFVSLARLARAAGVLGPSSSGGESGDDALRRRDERP